MSVEKLASNQITDTKSKITISGKEYKYDNLCLWQRAEIGRLFAGVNIDKTKLSNDTESIQYCNQFVNTYANKAVRVIATILYGRNVLMRSFLTRGLGKMYIKYKVNQLKYKVNAEDYLNIIVAIITSQDVANFMTATTFIPPFRHITREEIVAMTK